MPITVINYINSPHYKDAFAQLRRELAEPGRYSLSARIRDGLSKEIQKREIAPMSCPEYLINRIIRDTLEILIDAKASLEG